ATAAGTPEQRFAASMSAAVAAPAIPGRAAPRPLVRRRPPRPARLPRRWPEALGWAGLLAGAVAGIVAVAAMAGAKPRQRADGGVTLDGLGATLQQPAVALVVAALLVLVVAWAFQRLWLMLLAWWPGPVRVHDIVISADAAECDAAALTTHLRHRLGNLRIRSPATAPGATPERSFIDSLADAKLDTRNPLGSLVGVLRATKPNYGYEVRASLTTRPAGPRWAVSVEAVRLPNEAVATGTYRARTPWEAVEIAGDAVAAGILPRTWRCGAPWSGWRRFRMRPELLHAYERAAELTEARRYDEALEMYYRALGYDPMNLDIRLHVGFLQEKMGLFVDALAMYASAREVGLARQRGTYDVLARLRRRASCRVARYRLCALLSGCSLPEQWRRNPRESVVGPE